MDHLGFPKGPDDLDAEWFTSALRSTATIGENVAVTAFESEPIGVGIGVLGLLWRISLTYDTPGLGPSTAVLKLPHTGAESRHVADSFRFYEREVRFYEYGAARSPIRTAARYASAYDEASGDFLLLMEDVGSRRCHDQVGDAHQRMPPATSASWLACMPPGGPRRTSAPCHGSSASRTRRTRRRSSPRCVAPGRSSRTGSATSCPVPCSMPPGACPTSSSS